MHREVLLLITLLLNRFNVVAENGHDDIEMWIRPYKFYNACDTSIGLELELRGFLSERSKGRNVKGEQLYIGAPFLASNRNLEY